MNFLLIQDVGIYNLIEDIYLNQESNLTRWIGKFVNNIGKKGKRLRGNQEEFGI